MTDLRAAMQAIWDAATDAPARVWDEGLESRMDQIAASIDEDGRFRPLGPRKDRR